MPKAAPQASLRPRGGTAALRAAVDDATIDKIGRKHETAPADAPAITGRGIVQTKAGPRKRLVANIAVDLFDEVEARARAVRGTVADQVERLLRAGIAAERP